MTGILACPFCGSPLARDSHRGESINDLSSDSHVTGVATPVTFEQNIEKLKEIT